MSLKDRTSYSLKMQTIGLFDRLWNMFPNVYEMKRFETRMQ